MLVFLDIDGVLSTPSSLAAACRGGVKRDEQLRDALDERLIKHLSEALSRGASPLDTKIVISSSWRILFMEQLPRWLKEKGLSYEVIGRTPKLYTDEPGVASVARGLEISAWLWLNREKYWRPRYVVIDDESDAGFGHEGRFVKCDMNRGFDMDTELYATKLLREINGADPY